MCYVHNSGVPALLTVFFAPVVEAGWPGSSSVGEGLGRQQQHSCGTARADDSRDLYCAAAAQLQRLQLSHNCTGMAAFERLDSTISGVTHDNAMCMVVTALPTH